MSLSALLLRARLPLLFLSFSFAWRPLVAVAVRPRASPPPGSSATRRCSVLMLLRPRVLWKV